ncbi:hypothetical protein ACIRL2_09540 [Embleya sp. NPDC127516]
MASRRAAHKAPDTRSYAFCVEGIATFVIEDRCATVTIVEIR